MNPLIDFAPCHATSSNLPSMRGGTLSSIRCASKMWFPKPSLCADEGIGIEMIIVMEVTKIRCGIIGLFISSVLKYSCPYWVIRFSEMVTEVYHIFFGHSKTEINKLDYLEKNGIITRGCGNLTHRRKDAKT